MDGYETPAISSALEDDLALVLSAERQTAELRQTIEKLATRRRDDRTIVDLQSYLTDVAGDLAGLRQQVDDLVEEEAAELAEGVRAFRRGASVVSAFAA